MRRHPDVGVLVLSHYLDSRYAARLLEEVPAGAGYLLKDRVSEVAVVADALRRIADGDCVIDPTIVSRLVARKRARGPLDVLTEREREVLALVAEGRSNGAIGEQLFLSRKTVDSYVSQIFTKLDLTSRPSRTAGSCAVLTYLRAPMTRPRESGCASDSVGRVTSELSVRAISAEQHLAFVRAQPTVSFLQTPAWAAVKSEWRAESLGWFDGDDLVGAGLVLHRPIPIPKTRRTLPRTLAYLPEGPVIDWSADDIGAWLAPMAKHLKAQGAFAVRMGPPVVTRRWSATQVKDGIADPAVRRLDDVAPSRREPVGARVASAAAWARLAAPGR